MARLLTQSQFARRIKLTRGRISQLVKAGVIILVDGRVDPVQAETAIKNKVDRSRQMDLELKSNQEEKLSPTDKKFSPNQTSSNGPTLTDVRRDHELLKADLTALQLQIKKGELVPKDQAINWLTSHIAVAKLAFQNFPKRLAPVIRLKKDEKEIELELRTEIYKILKELAKPIHATSSHRDNKERNS